MEFYNFHWSARPSQFYRYFSSCFLLSTYFVFFFVAEDTSCFLVANIYACVFELEITENNGTNGVYFYPKYVVILPINNFVNF